MCLECNHSVLYDLHCAYFSLLPYFWGEENRSLYKLSQVRLCDYMLLPSDNEPLNVIKSRKFGAKYQCPSKKNCKLDMKICKCVLRVWGGLFQRVNNVEYLTNSRNDVPYFSRCWICAKYYSTTKCTPTMDIYCVHLPVIEENISSVTIT